MKTMRAKMKVTEVEKHSTTSETLRMRAVCKPEGYPADGSDEDNNFARWTPNAQLNIQIANPELLGVFPVGAVVYVDVSLVP